VFAHAVFRIGTYPFSSIQRNATGWLTSVDYKKLGIMYIVVTLIMLCFFSAAVMIRLQQALGYMSPGYLRPHHYDQVFTARGVITIFFMAMTFMIGLMNLIVSLQIGAL
jgi:cytochrome o ubiquinol oxidase subunit 1